MVTRISKQLPLGSYTVNFATLAFVGTDAANGNDFQAGGADMLLLHNDTGAAVGFTVLATYDSFGRVQHMTGTIAAGAYAMIGPLADVGWRTQQGTIEFLTDAAIKAAVIALQ